MFNFMPQKNQIINTFVTGARLAKVLGELDKVSRMNNELSKHVGAQDKIISDLRFEIEALMNRCATLEEDHRYCTQHDQEYILSKDGTFKCVSCELFLTTGYSFECDEHGLYETSCGGCNQNDRRMGE